MLLGVPKEIKNHEYRVGLAPGSVREAVQHGHQVIVETGESTGIGSSDAEYQGTGAEIVGATSDVFARAGMIVKVK
jgi:alanine dehydrogenase